MMYEREILETLQKATTAAIAASVMSSLAVVTKYVGRTLVPPSDQKYIELVWIPNNPDGDFWGNEQNYQGMFRIILHWPNDSIGAYGPMDVLSSVCSYFTKDRFLAGVTISENPKMMTPLERGTETLYVSTLKYTAFRTGA